MRLVTILAFKYKTEGILPAKLAFVPAMEQFGLIIVSLKPIVYATSVRTLIE